MEYQFSDRVVNLKPSAIREILKYSSDPAVIPLSAGNPAPEAFPTQAIAEISKRVLTEEPVAALQYSVTEGYRPLRVDTHVITQTQVGHIRQLPADAGGRNYIVEILLEVIAFT